MKVFSFLGFLLTLAVIFWLLDVSIDILDQQCQLEKSLWERVILTVKEFFGVVPPDNDWWRPLCELTPSKLRGYTAILCNAIVTIACIVYFLRRLHKKKEYREIPPPHSLKHTRNPHKRRSSEGDSTTAKKNKRDFTQFTRRPRPRKTHSVRQRKRWYDGYLFIPHMPTTEQTVFRAVLLGPINDCFQYLISLLTSTFAKHGVFADAIKWAHSTDQVDTMTYVTGQSEWMKVEAELTHFGINICIHRVVKVQGLLRFVNSRAYQLTYMGLTCVGQDSNIMYGAGWDL